MSESSPFLNGQHAKEGSGIVPEPSAVRIKICGLQDVEVLKSMIPLPIDYIGFVFARSKRQIDRERAAELLEVLKRWHGQAPQSVGVFVNPTLDELLHITAVAPLDVIQLHGSETPAFCREVRATLQVQVIKVISIAAQVDSEGADHSATLSDTVTGTSDRLHADKAAAAKLAPYEGAVDAFLLDTHDPLYGGGSGKTFAWDGITPYHRWTEAHDIPLLIAGGLSPDNVHELVGGYPLEGIDVSSGVETDGVKDIDKIKRFVERARA
ncbi:phosphoribosylanthranilate isomerase [Paenibacillus campi]|uniref:phosphoribosylanthranilate isomerase n=1 Tax=Paenibacillus campi TaxID=3106031 RepID=UPI002AFE9823|nr:phosphoribosylanthranilate isomerase [Paenibacillus sp. SGZ-1009]